MQSGHWSERGVITFFLRVTVTVSGVVRLPYTALLVKDSYVAIRKDLPRLVGYTATPLSLQ